jgi:hypothetical protein
MGYGAGHGIELNKFELQVKFNGRNLIPVEFDFESWNFSHPVNGIGNLRPDMLKGRVIIEKLTDEDIKSLKDNGYEKGEIFSVGIEENPHGIVWSGYVRSLLRKSFPIYLKSRIDIPYMGCYIPFEVKIQPADYKDFQIFLDDLGYYPKDEEIKQYMEDNELQSDNGVIEQLYTFHNDDIRENWKVNKI